MPPAGRRPCQTVRGDLLTPHAVFCDDDAIVVGKEAIKNAALAQINMGMFQARHGRHDLSTQDP